MDANGAPLGPPALHSPRSTSFWKGSLRHASRGRVQERDRGRVRAERDPRRVKGPRRVGGMRYGRRMDHATTAYTGFRR